ncbi:MAG: rhomboid family intramembrane serine protease [Planctomycetes bacterium]|nr:rhomboid family intramembrane serine protease [Planctomycetota bacterium]
MIPLRDINPTQRFPVLSVGIIAINALIFLATSSDLSVAAQEFGAVAYHFSGADPASLSDGHRWIQPVPDDDRRIVRAVSHMWLHGGFLHLLGNMWFVWVFGDNVEDRLGRARYLVLYFASGFAALLAQILADPAFGQPMIGASGAVSGVLGAYVVLFPHARILTLVPIGWIFFTTVWPAFAFLGIWFLIQLLQGMLAPPHAGGVAWWAHAGGFVVGAALAMPHALRSSRRIRIEVDGRRR